VALLLALVAAALYAAATVLQQRAAAAVPPAEAGAIRLIWRLAHRPMWLAGKAADLAATGVKAVALARGTLILVEATLSTGVLMTLALAAALAHRFLSWSEAVGAVALALGLTLLAGVGRPTGPKESVSATALVLACLLVGALVLYVLLVVPTSVIALAGGAGAAFAVDSALLKAAAQRADTAAWLAVPTIAAVVGFLVVAAAGNVLVQRAFQLGSLHQSLPTLTVSEPVASIALGAAVFHERLRGGAVPAVAEVAGVVLMLLGVVAVTRSRTAVTA
jgi:drug/metabolite transporter (DMT)-like permease